MKKSYSKPAVYIECLNQSSTIMTCGTNVTEPDIGVNGELLAVEKIGCNVDITQHTELCYHLPLPGSNAFTS